MSCLRASIPSVLALAALLCCPASGVGTAVSAPLSVVDDRGAVVRMEHRPARIVTLAPHLAELLFAAGAGDRLVGVSEFTDWPPETTRRPKVTGGGRVEFERLTMLRPDLVLAWFGGNRPADIERIERSGVAVIATSADGLGDVPRLLRFIGAAADTERIAVEAANAFEKRLLMANRKRARPLRAFYAIWDRPLMTVGQRHWISDVLHRCGALNVMGNGPGTAFTVSLEQVYAADPDVIIIDPSPASHQRWHARKGLRAVVAGNVISPNPDLLQRIGPRALDGMVELCDVLDRAGAAPDAGGRGSL